MKATIKIGTHTASHRATLEAKGYQVQEVNGTLEVECTGFRTDPFLLNKENLVALVAAKELLTYRTPIGLPDGRWLTSILACSNMERFFQGSSALVAKPATAAAKTGTVVLDW